MIHFNDLKNRHCLLLDGTSVRLVSDKEPKKLLNEKCMKGGRDWRNLYSTNPLTRHALDILSRVVIYDCLVVDAEALKHPDIGETLLPNLICMTNIPKRLDHEFWDKLPEKYFQGIVPSEISLLPWWDNDDNMGRIEWEDIRGNVRNLATRPFFYVDVGRAARVPLLLSPKKTQYLETSKYELIPEVFRKLEKRIDSALMSKINAIFSQEGEEGALLISEPPLVDWIIRNAEAKHLSLVDSALALRETRDAIAFRVWLKNVQMDIASGDRVRIIQAANEAKSADKYITEWTQALSPQVGLTKTKRTLTLGKIPVLGWILDLANASELTVDDPLLTAPEAHLAFIAKMYSEVKDE